MKNLNNSFRPARRLLLKPLLVPALLLVAMVAGLGVFGQALHAEARSAAPSVRSVQISPPAAVEPPQANPVSVENVSAAGVSVAGQPNQLLNTMYLALAVFELASPYLEGATILLSIFLFGRAVFLPGLSWGARIRRGLFAGLVLFIGLALPGMPYWFGGSGCGG